MSYFCSVASALDSFRLSLCSIMKKKYFLTTFLLLLCSFLFSKNIEDSLYLEYSNKISYGKQAVGRQLVTYFIQQNYYDYPIHLQKKQPRAHLDMLVKLGMAKAAYHRADLDKAESYAQKALSTVNKDSLLWKVACQEILAEVYLRKGKMGDALKLVESNYEIGRKANDNAVIGYSLVTMSGINLTFFKYQEALDYVNEAITIERKSKNTKRLAICLGMKSDIFLKLNKIDSSLIYIDEALAIDEQAHREDKIGIRLSQKADILIQLAKWNEAEAICLKARSIFQKSNSIMDEAKTLLQLGTCKRNLKQYDKSEQYLLSGQQICESIGYKSLLWEIQKELFLLYKDQNNLGTALSYFEKSVANRDSVIEEEYMYQLGDYKAKFDTQEKENQLELAKEKNKLKIIVIILLGTILFLFVLLSFHTWRIAKLRKIREEELAESNATKDKIFSVISHDLKNPVAAQKQVLGYLDSQYGQISETDKKEMISMLKQSCDSLSDLLLDLFEWSSYNSGRIEYHPIRTDLYSVINSTLEKISMQAHLKNIRFENSVRPNSFVFTDVAMLETVLRNLCTNAVKFSHNDNVVEIKMEEHDNEVWVLITDKGIGMSEETLAKLYKQEVVTMKGTAGEPDTGLGVKMCKALVEKNHGQLSMQSKEGEGCTFSFSLPKAETKNE